MSGLDEPVSQQMQTSVTSKGKKISHQITPLYGRTKTSLKMLSANLVYEIRQQCDGNICKEINITAT